MHTGSGVGCFQCGFCSVVYSVVWLWLGLSAESPDDSHLILEQIVLYPIKSCGPCKVCVHVYGALWCAMTHMRHDIFMCAHYNVVCVHDTCVCVCTGGEVLTKLTFVSYLTNENEVMSFTTSFSNKRGRRNLY